MKAVDLWAPRVKVMPHRRGQEDWLTVICKRQYRIDPVSQRLLEAPERYAPLCGDLKYTKRDDRIGRSLIQGRDLWPHKARTDLIVQGDAMAWEGRPCSEMQVSVAFGETDAQAQVIGSRIAYRKQGKLCFSAPRPFVSMPVDDFHSYGGIDPTLMPESLDKTPMVLGLPVPELFPGAHPRNPAGMGYWVDPCNFVEGLRLPCVERVKDRLTPDRFFAQDPRAWPLMPRPLCWGFRSLWSYPRCLHLGRRPYAMPKLTDPAGLDLLEDPLDQAALRAKMGELQVSREMMQQGARELSIARRRGPLPLRLQGFWAKQACVELEIPDQAPSLKIFDRNKALDVLPARLTVQVDTKAHALWITWGLSARLDTPIDMESGIDQLKARCRVEFEGQALGSDSWPAKRPCAT